MEQIRRSKSFLSNYMSHEQKILHKFDCSNVIDASSATGSESESGPSDVDEIMVQNLSHKSGLVAMFTVGKLNKILKPYTAIKKLPEFDLKLFKSFFAKDVNLTQDLTIMSTLRKKNPIGE
jgi:hypothetical protein